MSFVTSFRRVSEEGRIAKQGDIPPMPFLEIPRQVFNVTNPKQPKLGLHGVFNLIFAGFEHSSRFFFYKTLIGDRSKVWSFILFWLILKSNMSHSFSFELHYLNESHNQSNDSIYLKQYLVSLLSLG